MPLLWLAIAFTSGIFSAWFLDLPSSYWMVSTALTGLLAIIEGFTIPSQSHPLRSRKIFRVSIGILLLGFTLGGWRFHGSMPKPLPNITSVNDSVENALVFGKVVSFPDHSGSLVSADIEVEKIAIQGKVNRVNTRILLRMPGRYRLEYGDQLVLFGKLEPLIKDNGRTEITHHASRGMNWEMNFPDVSISEYDQGNPLLDWVYRMRENAYEEIFRWMPFPESALLSGILLGIEWNLPDLLVEAYRSTSTLHIIAISGFNIAVIAGIFTRLFRRFLPTYWDGLCALGAITIYTLFVGADPSVVRAAWMAALSLPAYYLGRRAIGVNLLSGAALVMLMRSPLLLWNISFQLSFLATLGLMTLADPLIAWLNIFLSKFLPDRSVELANPVLVLIATTVAAQFSVLPILYRLDNTFSPLALPANLLILPLQPPLMILGGLALLLGFFMPRMGSFLAAIAWLPAALSNRIALRLSLIPRQIFTLPDWSWIPAAILVSAAIIWLSARQIRGYEQPPGDQSAS